MLVLKCLIKVLNPLQRPVEMGAAGRPRPGFGRGRRGPADPQNRRPRPAPGLQPVVGVRRHRPLPAERAGPVQSVRLAGVHQHRDATAAGRQTSRGHRLGPDHFGYVGVNKDVSGIIYKPGAA